MSFQAVAWAMRQSLPAMEKMVLIVLADHLNKDTLQCNPRVKTITEEAGMSQRHVNKILVRLEESGYIQIVHQTRDDGSFTASQYSLLIDRMELDLVHSRHYPPVHRTGGTVPQTDLEPVIEPVIEPVTEPGTEPRLSTSSAIATDVDKHPFAKKQQPGGQKNGNKEHDVWPDWYSTLYAIPGFKVPLENAEAWRMKSLISLDLAETTAYALKSKWPGDVKKPYRDPWATFQNWCRMTLTRKAKGQTQGATRVEARTDVEELRQSWYGNVGSGQRIGAIPR